MFEFLTAPYYACTIPTPWLQYVSLQNTQANILYALPRPLPGGDMQPPLPWLVCNVYLRSAPAHITARFHFPLPLSSVGQTCLPPVSMTALPPPLPRLPGRKPITGSKKYKYIPLTACNRFPVYWLPAVTASGRHLTYMQPCFRLIVTLLQAPEISKSRGCLMTS